MWVIYGLALTGAGILLLAYASKRNNAPSPPAWLRQGWIQQVIVFIVMVLVTFGGAALINAIVNFSSQSFELIQVLASVGEVVGFVVLWRMIMRIPSPVPATAAE